MVADEAKEITQLKEFDQNKFYPDIFIKYNKEEAMNGMMQDIMASISQDHFIKYFTVSVGNALDEYENKLSEGQAARGDLSIAIMRC